MQTNSEAGKGHPQSGNWRRNVRRRRPVSVALLPIAATCLLASAVMSANQGTVDIDQARTMLEKWVETRRIISQEKHDWELAREVLNERIDLIQSEIDALRDKINEAEKEIAETEEKRSELMAENEKLKEASAALSSTVVTLETRTTEFLTRLPDAVRERVKPLIQRLPENPDETKQSLSQRFQNVIGILNEVNKFNSEITTTSEVRTLSDGTSAEVSTFYVGIGKAYYVSSNESAAGVGTASPDGWVWKPASNVAEQIAKAIAILKNDQVASFVRLPIDIQ